MKSPTQTNAIDFDSAKLQRLGFGQLPPLLERPASLAQLRQIGRASCRERVYVLV